MSTRNEFLRYLIGYGTYLPVVVIWIVGVIVSLTRWKRHPKISMLALIGLLGFLVMFLLNMIVNIWASQTFYKSGDSWTPDQVETFYTVKGIITALIDAGLWAMIVYALFAMRGEPGRLPQANYGPTAGPAASA